MNEKVSKEIESVKHILSELNELVCNISPQENISFNSLEKSKQNIKLLKSWVKGVGKRLNKIPDKKHFY
jgi:hypothetical protein